MLIDDLGFLELVRYTNFVIIIIIIITLEFVSDLGHKLSSFSGEERASSFLFQRLSVSLQCFNSVLLHDTFVIDDVPEQ